MFLRLPITQPRPNTSMVNHEVWKLTKIVTNEDFDKEIVDVQRVHIVDRTELKGTRIFAYQSLPILFSE